MSSKMDLLRPELGNWAVAPSPRSFRCGAQVIAKALAQRPLEKLPRWRPRDFAHKHYRLRQPPSGEMRGQKIE
jgi:hypothetical protein